MRRALVLATLLVAAAGAPAAERVLDFHSDIRIAADSTLTVIETIVVQAEGRQIRHGIYRDFPTDYRDRLGQRVQVGFDVVSVLRDGGPTPWITQHIANGVRVRIGDPNALVAPGRHEYSITYRATRELGYFSDHDELYWNVNGNGWVFPIDRVSADVYLPASVPAAQLSAEAYTGPFGARGRDYRSALRTGGASFESTRAFAPHEGMTIVLTFPKGIVAPPGMRQELAWWVRDNRGAAFGALGALVMIAFLWWRWRLVGRDPRAGPTYPRYEPPPGIGAAGVRFIDKMSYDERCLAAALLGLGARGYLRIHQHGDSFEIERTGKALDSWLPGELPLATALLGGKNSALIARQHDPEIQAARATFRSTLERDFAGRLFARNEGSFVAGVAIAAASMWAMIFYDTDWRLMAPVALAMFVTLVVFRKWLPAYSVEGRRLQDHIEGLRQYLSVAEADELRRIKAPEQTSEEFARFLPYALALGVEKTWADRFAAVLGAAAVTAAVAHYYLSDPGGGLFGSQGGVGGLTDSLASMDSTISAASTPPGSSSGSSGGGGGSSGGGGGGGGGGGW